MPRQSLRNYESRTRIDLVTLKNAIGTKMHASNFELVYLQGVHATAVAVPLAQWVVRLDYMEVHAWHTSGSEKQSEKENAVLKRIGN